MTPGSMDGGPPLFKIWLEQDVVWIATPGERTAFKLLQNDEQRDEFVEAFGSGAIPLPIPARMQSKTNPSASCLCQRTALACESRMEDGPRATSICRWPARPHNHPGLSQRTGREIEDGQNYDGQPTLVSR